MEQGQATQTASMQSNPFRQQQYFPQQQMQQPALHYGQQTMTQQQQQQPNYYAQHPVYNQGNNGTYYQYYYDPSYHTYMQQYYAQFGMYVPPPKPANMMGKGQNQGQTHVPPGFDTSSCRSLYIGNLSPKVSEGLLYDVFAMMGPVETCKLIKDKVSGESLGYGFAEYFDHASALNALTNLAGKLLYGLEIKVNWAFASTQKDTTTHYHVFVGDLSPEIDDKALFNAFTAFGSISDARIIWDTNTGRSKGYGFVSFKKKEDAQRALTEMNGEFLGKRAIRCNWANQKGGLDQPPGMGGGMMTMPK